MTRSVWLFVLTAAMAALIVSRPEASTPPNTAGVVVPFYGATFGTPGGFSAADSKRVLELLESIDRRLEVIEQRSAPAPVKKGLELGLVAKSRCASCHTPDRADAKGGGFILFTDEKGTALKPLSGREKVRIREAVQGGTMPPNKKLDAAERSVFEW